MTPHFVTTRSGTTKHDCAGRQRQAVLSRAALHRIAPPSGTIKRSLTERQPDPRPDNTKRQPGTKYRATRPSGTSYPSRTQRSGKPRRDPTERQPKARRHRAALRRIATPSGKTWLPETWPSGDTAQDETERQPQPQRRSAASPCPAPHLGVDSGHENSYCPEPHAFDGSLRPGANPDSL
jgi:hypothetical protein